MSFVHLETLETCLRIGNSLRIGICIAHRMAVAVVTYVT